MFVLAYLAKGAPAAEAKQLNSLAKKVAKATSLLHSTLSPTRRYDEHWHAEHTPNVVSRTRLLKRHNAVDERKLQKTFDEIADLQQKGMGTFSRRRGSAFITSISLSR